MIRDKDRCDGPLKQVGVTDKGLPMYFCTVCRKVVDGYNHLSGEIPMFNFNIAKWSCFGKTERLWLVEFTDGEKVLILKINEGKFAVLYEKKERPKKAEGCPTHNYGKANHAPLPPPETPAEMDDIIKEKIATIVEADDADEDGGSVNFFDGFESWNGRW